jgi:hypothetical protein
MEARAEREQAIEKMKARANELLKFTTKPNKSLNANVPAPAG